MLTQPQALSLFVLISGGLFYWWWSRQHQGSSSNDAGTILERYTHDLTHDAQQGKLDPVIGRDEEIERMIHILSRRSKNNPLLIGEPGVGKTAVVEGIALAIAGGEVPATINGKRVLALDLGALIGGTKYRGEFEERMKRLTDDIKAQARTIILFIDEVHMVEQAKGAEGAINVSDIIKPALARGDLQLVGATTWKEYEQYIKPDDALDRRMQPIVIGEPNDEAALLILQGVKGVYEQHHHVAYDDDALRAAIRLSKEQIHSRYLPDKAIDLIDEAGAKVSIDFHHDGRHALGLLHAAGADKQAQLAALENHKTALSQELEHLKNLETEMQDESELKDIHKRLQHLYDALERISQQLNASSTDAIPHVTVADIEEVVHEWLGIMRGSQRPAGSQTL